MHPIYHSLQKYVLDGRTKELVRQAYQLQEESELPDTYIEGAFSIYENSNLTTRDMYNHLQKNEPLIVIDGCKNWPAIELWQNQSYLVDMAKLTQSRNYAWEVNPTGSEELDAHLAKIKRIRENGLPGYGLRREAMPHMTNLCISRNQELVDDYEIPEFLSRLT